MRRAFVEPGELQEASPGGRLLLPREAAHHLTRVLRLPADTAVELFDGEGRVVRGRLQGDPPATLWVDEVCAAARTLPPLIMAQALVRGPKLEEVVRRATELGASALWVFAAARSAVPAGSLRDERLWRIAREAARQSERVDVPELVGPFPFEELLARVAAFPGVTAIGVLRAERSLSGLLRSAPRFPTEGALFVVGPEGGLAPEEVARLQQQGAEAVRLGPHVQRTETAGLSALAASLTAIDLL